MFHDPFLSGALRPWARRAGLCLLATCCWLPWQASSHEHHGHRVTVVQREAGHWQLVLRLNPLVLLKDEAPAAAPSGAQAAGQAAPAWMSWVALPPAEFERHWGKLVLQLQGGVSLQGASAVRVPAQGWRWPAAAQVQSLLQQQAMLWLTNPRAHLEPEALEVTADVVHAGPSPKGGWALSLPARLRPAVVVSYRPSQVWTPAGEAVVPLAF